MVDTLVAARFNASEERHLLSVAEIIKSGGIVAFPFNGVYGLFGDIDQPSAAREIYKTKGRPPDQRLIAVIVPERIGEHVDFARVPYEKQKIISLWGKIHALGIILPASEGAPAHLTVGEGESTTILNIWTEYHPLRKMIEYFQSLGGRGLVGTSANKLGEPTHFKFESLCQDFKKDVQAAVFADFDHLPPHRRQSTTIIDLTGRRPRLHRKGNVPEDELRQFLEKHEFPELEIGPDVITVRPR